MRKDGRGILSVSRYRLSSIHRKHGPAQAMQATKSSSATALTYASRGGNVQSVVSRKSQFLPKTVGCARISKPSEWNEPHPDWTWDFVCQAGFLPMSFCSTPTCEHHDAKTRTFRSTLPVARTHRIDILAALEASLAASPLASFAPVFLINGGAQRMAPMKWSWA